MRRGLPAPAASLLLLAAVIQAAACVQGASISKRSVSALARTSQLPHSSTGSSDQGGLGGLGHDQEHGAQHPDQHKRSELQDEAIREELLRQRAAPVSEALLSAIMAADQYGYDNGIEEKRSLSSLARYGNLPAPADEKRSLSSLARYGNLPAPADEKRSLSSLARVGNFPISKDDDEKRSLASLARYGNLPTQADEIKRSLTSIARLGGLPSTGKRSLEALARGGLLNKNTRVDASKRSVSALARAGELPGKRFIPDQQREQAQDLLDVLQRELDETKRSLSSLARAGELANRPALVAESLDGLPWEVNKRSLESLARTWNRPDHSKRSPPYGAFDLMESQYAPWGKRNAAALLRQTKFQTPDGSPVDESQRDDSDHQGGQGRRKRSLWDEDLYGEVASPYVQSSARGTAPGQEPDWEPMWSPSAWGAYFGYGEDTAAPPQQKRFLGSVARSWGPSSWRPASPAMASPANEEAVDVSKRHIGTLARSGMLPAFRSLRYARSGRAVASAEDSFGAFGASDKSSPLMLGRMGGGGPGTVRYRRVCSYFR